MNTCVYLRTIELDWMGWEPLEQAALGAGSCEHEQVRGQEMRTESVHSEWRCCEHKGVYCHIHTCCFCQRKNFLWNHMIFHFLQKIQLPLMGPLTCGSSLTRMASWATWLALALAENVKCLWQVCHHHVRHEQWGHWCWLYGNCWESSRFFYKTKTPLKRQLLQNQWEKSP